MKILVTFDLVQEFEIRDGKNLVQFLDGGNSALAIGFD